MLDILLNNPGLIHLASFLGGVFLTLLGNYLKFASDIAFIKGQLSELIRKVEAVDDLYEKHVTLEREFARTALDLTRALEEIRYIKHKVLKESANGGIYGTDS